MFNAVHLEYYKLSLLPHRPPASGTALSEDDLSTILNEIQEARTRSYYVGLNLKLPKSLLDSISREYADDLDRLLHVVDEFLKCIEPRPTWPAIVSALRSPLVAMSELAAKIEQKYCSPPEQEPETGSQPYRYFML